MERRATAAEEGTARRIAALERRLTVVRTGELANGEPETGEGGGWRHGAVRLWGEMDAPVHASVCAKCLVWLV